ncbi:MAG: histidine phosphatase family protein [Nanoarchaeota archaeon]
MLKLIIVRHGVTEWNKEGRLQGKKDIPLSKEGEEQADKLAKRLKDEKIDIIYSSPLKRAYKTAETINRYHKLEIKTEEGLKEISYGIFDGISKEEREKDDNLKKIWAERKKDLLNNKFEGGESFADLLKRVERSLKKILDNDKKTILVVCHGQTKRALVKLLTNMSIEEIHMQRFKTTAVSIFEIDKKEAKTILINCAKHLE